MASSNTHPWRPAPDQRDIKPDPSSFVNDSQTAGLARTVVLENLKGIISKLQSQTIIWTEKTSKQLIESLTLHLLQLEGLLAFIDNNYAESISNALVYYHSQASDSKMGVMSRPLVEVTSKSAGPYEGSSGLALMTSPFLFPASGKPDFQATNTAFVFQESDPAAAVKLPTQNETPQRAQSKSNRGRYKRVQPYVPPSE
jgi:hypothetical protein